MRPGVLRHSVAPIAALTVVLLSAFVAGGNATDLFKSSQSYAHGTYISQDLTTRFGHFHDTTTVDFAYLDDSHLFIYRNAGYGAFSLHDSTSWSAGVLTAGDFNADGLTDLVTKGGDNSGIGDYDLFLNNPGTPGSFTHRYCPVDTVGLGIYATYATMFGKCGDLDGDGDLDCAHWIWDGTAVSLMNLNDSDSLVPNPNNNGLRYITVNCSNGCQDGELVDLDGDGDLDIVTANNKWAWGPDQKPDSPWVSIFRNNGSGSFTYTDTIHSTYGTSARAWRVTSGKFNSDNYPDVVVAYRSWLTGQSDSLLFYKGSSNGVLSYDTAIAIIGPTWLEAADLDDNGHVDLITAEADSLVIFYNDGSRHFTTEVIKYPDTAGHATRLIQEADVDRDGDLDLLVSANARGGRRSWIFFNHSVADTAGDVNGDGAINVSDFTYLQSYLYSGGSAPTPWYAGDCNFDGVTNAADVTYLQDYLWSNGPMPFIH